MCTCAHYKRSLCRVYYTRSIIIYVQYTYLVRLGNLLLRCYTQHITHHTQPPGGCSNISRFSAPGSNLKFKGEYDDIYPLGSHMYYEKIVKRSVHSILGSSFRDFVRLDVMSCEDVIRCQMKIRQNKSENRNFSPGCDVSTLF